MTEAITNLQRLLVKSYVLSAPFINRKAFPIGYHGAQVLRSASRYSARLKRSPPRLSFVSRLQSGCSSPRPDIRHALRTRS